MTHEVFARQRLKHSVQLRRERADASDPALRYVGLEHVGSGTGKLLPVTDETFNDKPAQDEGETASTSTRFASGDVLFGKLRPYLAKAFLADFPGRCSAELLVMRPTAFESGFLRYVCLWRDFLDEVDASTFGSKMPRADWESVGNVFVPVPDMPVQRAIADYLDRETARLDALVAAKERALSLLIEKKKAVTSRVVTRGCDESAPTRESGVDWLGLIPGHWDTRRVSWLFRERDERCEPDLPLLEVSLNTGVALREFSSDRIEGTAADFNTYKVARRGDIVFNKMRMWQGAVGVAPQDGLVSPDYVVAAPTGPLTSAFAGLLFRTGMFSAECCRRSRGIVWDRLRLYWDDFREIVLPLPSMEEQDEIVYNVAARFARIDALVGATERSIALIKERRSALISAAVTGALKIA